MTIPLSTASLQLRHVVELASSHALQRLTESGKVPRETVSRQLEQVTAWMLRPVAEESAGGRESRPPAVGREYVDVLLKQMLSVLATQRNLALEPVVTALWRLQELSEGTRRPDRARLMSRLSGDECVEAVVAIAHDLRSPLSSILILLDSLRRHRGPTGRPSGERRLGLIYGAAHELTTLVSDLIDAARGEGLVMAEPTPLSVTEIMLAVSSIVQPICEERGLPLLLQAPKIDARMGHAAALHRVLLNLTSNALKYTDTGSVSMGCAEVSTSALEFWVADTGEGLPPKVLESLHDGFFRDGKAVRFSSAGLGLVIVRALLDAMGSEMHVETGPTGTRFSFVLELEPV